MFSLHICYVYAVSPFGLGSILIAHQLLDCHALLQRYITLISVYDASYNHGQIVCTICLFHLAYYYMYMFRFALYVASPLSIPLRPPAV